MRSGKKRTGALLLALVLLLTAVPATAVDSEAYGTLRHSAETALHHGVTHYNNIYWSDYYSDLRQENYFVYTPGGAVRPVVAAGSSVSGRLTGKTAAAELEAKGLRVVAGVNGDYFEASGTPIGLLIADGRLLSSDAGLPAVGFTAQGQAVIGQPMLTFTLTDADGSTIRPVGLNKIRSSAGGIHAYTYDFNDKHTTGTVESGVEAVLAPVEGGEPAIGKSVRYRVVSVAETVTTTIAQGQLVLSVNHQAPAEQLTQLRSLTAGQELTLTVTADDEKWNDVVAAVGGLHVLVKEGQPQTNTTVQNGPRTAVGVRQDGSVVLYTVDGRQPGSSIGASLTTLGQRMAELGCVEALCLDGGGSTTALASMPDSKTAAVLNRPSDGAARQVSNLLMLTAAGGPTGLVDGIYLADPGPCILTGATTELRASLVDSNYYPVPGTVGLYASAGQVEGGTYTAPDTAAVVTIAASSWGYATQRTITAVEVPERLTLSAAGKNVTALTLEPGGQVQLTAGARWAGMSVICANDDFSWSVSEGIGTVDENGLFTASQNPGSGTVTVSRGAVSVALPVTITARPMAELESFEGDVSRYYGYGVTPAQETSGDRVHRGGASLRVDYRHSGDGAALYTGWTMPAGYDKLVLSVYGDGSGNTLSVFDDLGRTTPAAVLDFTGWKRLAIPVPEGADTVTALIVSGAAAQGTLWLDQAVASYGDVLDETGPAVGGSVLDNTLTASVWDSIDGALPAAQIALTTDGVPLSFTCSGGQVTAALPEPGTADRRITLTARDNSGNLTRMSWDQPGTDSGGAAFADLTKADGQPHWAAPYVQYLWGRGVITGYDGPEGTMVVRPDKELTRAEFAVMLYRWLGLREADYEQVELPFADEAAIADWVKPAARAMYALGVIQGSGDGRGGLLFNGGSTLTRAQAVTMLGRIQEKGYAAGGLDGFADGGEVPAWAADYLATMVAQGVLTGMDGNLRPTRTMTRGQAAKVLWALS